MRALITGGCGFIGKNFVNLLNVSRPEIQILNVDCLTYAGNTVGLPARSETYEWHKVDICDAPAVSSLMKGVDIVIHFAAESHVDRSILDPSVFVRTNVVGTQVLLESARQAGVPTFIQISTDEVYGQLMPGDPAFSEATQVSPRSPYSASKAAADHFAMAYHHTFGMDVRVTRCSNNYGPYQFPEKLIPLTIANALADRPIPVYGDGSQRRDWIHVEDHCRAILSVLDSGQPGQVYNIGGGEETENIEVIRTVLREMGRSDDLITFVKDRPGHDFRYAMNASKSERELGWEPQLDFGTGIRKTVAWYLDHRDWWEPLLDENYHRYYERQYRG